MNTQQRESFFIKVYDEHSDALFRFCYFKLFDRELAKDMVQEAFMRTWTQISEGKELTNAKAFLYTVAGNLMKDYWKKKKPVPFSNLENAEEEYFFDAPDEKMDSELDAEVRMAVRDFSKLPESDREVLSLRFVSGFTPKEIAEMLKERENTISVRLSRALDKLRKISTGNKTA